VEYEDILENLAPCGLSCRKCFANSEGDIALLSAQLQEQLGSFDVYAERFSAFLPAFKDYPPFKELLAYLVQGHLSASQLRRLHLLSRAGCRFLLSVRRVPLSKDQLRPTPGRQVAPDERADGGDRR